MNNALIISLLSFPFISFSGDTRLTEPTLVIDNSTGKHTIVVSHHKKLLFIHPEQKKEINWENTDRYEPVKVLKANRQANAYEKYLIYIQMQSYPACAILNTATMQEEGDVKSLRIIKVLLERAKAKL